MSHQLSLTRATVIPHDDLIGRVPPVLGTGVSSIGMAIGATVAGFGLAAEHTVASIDPDGAMRWGLVLVGVAMAGVNAYSAYLHRKENDRRQGVIDDALTHARLATITRMEAENRVDMDQGKPPRWVILLPDYDEPSGRTGEYRTRGEGAK